MDHKLAIVIVPLATQDPVRASAALLECFEKVPLDGAAGGFEQKFRYKRVGGWFDGLAAGQAGQQRWTTVLEMLLEGIETNAASPFPGFGPETGPEIEGRIEAGNTRLLTDMSPLAPCSIIVTPDGDWRARDADRPDASKSSQTEDEAWEGVKRGVFEKYHGYMAVAWDLSWHFIGMTAQGESYGPPPAGAWGAKSAGSTRVESWAARISAARRISTERSHEVVAIDGQEIVAVGVAGPQPSPAGASVGA